MTKEPADKDISQSALYECLRPEIRKMAHRMEQNFRIHDASRGDPFQESDFAFLDERFDSEWDELMLAFGTAFRTDCSHPEDGSIPSEVWNEAADCCNFILMMAVKYERDWNKWKRG